jgi:hypothetical protein
VSPVTVLERSEKADADFLDGGEAGHPHYGREDARWWKAVLVLLLALFAFYLFMFLRYRPYDIDNPWFLSFSYNRFIDHIRSDQFAKVTFPARMDGTRCFGLLAAFPQYVVGHIAGCGSGPWRFCLPAR